MSSTLNALLQKTADWDKDERYMATSDLCTELQKDVKLDATMERRICAAVLKQLDDQSNDVQSIAVKCLGVLLKKVQKTQVGEIADKLCSLILDGKDELRDIYSIGLKTLLKDMPDDMGSTVCDKLTKRLLSGVQQGKLDVKIESLENLTDLLKRFGREVPQDHPAVLEVVMAQLSARTRKRAANCLAALALTASDQLLEQLILSLLSKIKQPGLIQTIGTISRAVGGRLGQHLNKLIPVFIEAMSDDMELTEYCLQGLESFTKCKEIKPHIHALTEVSLEYMKYDPNVYDDFSDDEYEEDDDSWKVRRAAIKLAKCGPFAVVAPALVERFKEREENVRVDVVEALGSLIRDNEVTNVPEIVAVATKQITSRSDKAKAACYSLLRDLAKKYPLGDISTAIEFGLSEKSQSLRLDAARLTRACLPHLFQYCKFDLIGRVAELVKEDWYKLIAEGLRLVTALAEIADQRLYEVAKSRLTKDIDHEIKECAIEAVAALVSYNRYPDALPLILERMKDSTRPVALRALQRIAKAGVNLQSILPQAVQELSLSLGRQSRHEATLVTLQALIENHTISDELASAILTETARHLNDEDLHLAHLAMRLQTLTINKSNVKPDISTMLLLSRSSLLQGVALDSLGELLIATAQKYGYSELYNGLESPVLVAVLIASTSVNEYVKDLIAKKAFEALGELGRRVELPQEAFDACTDSVKGMVAAGAPHKYLPQLLNTDNILALKQVTTYASNIPFVDQLLAKLLTSVESDEPTRTMVADCLGALARSAPEQTAKALDMLLEGQCTARWTAATALKHAPFKPPLVNSFTKALALLDDEDLDVRKAAFVMLNSTAHHQPGIINLEALIPVLRKALELKLERVVDLGPFKHKVDDGALIRKAAVSCIATFVETHKTPLLVPLALLALADKLDDVQVSAHALFVKMAEIVPDAIDTEPVIDLLDKAITKKFKDATSKTGTDSDRAYDLVRSALKAALALAPLSSNAQAFIDKLMKKDKIAAEILKLAPP